VYALSGCAVGAEPLVGATVAYAGSLRERYEFICTGILMYRTNVTGTSTDQRSLYSEGSFVPKNGWLPCFSKTTRGIITYVGASI
jgi:hypothetical protein